MKSLARRYDVWTVVVLFLFAIVAERVELFSALEDQFQSVRHALRADTPFPDDIAFVYTDEAFFAEYGSFPLRRTDIAKIAANARAYGAKVVGVDLLFDFKSSYDEDPIAASMFAEAGNMVAVSIGQISPEGELTGITYPVEPIRSAVSTGYSNIQSASGVIETMTRLRVYPQSDELQDDMPFVVQVLAKYLDAEPVLDANVLNIGDLRIELDRNHNFLIDFPALGGTGYAVQHGISALELLGPESSEYSQDELKALLGGKIVLLGDTSEVSHDYFDTPIGTLYGVEIIGAAIDTLMRRAPLVPAPQWLEVIVLLLAMAGLLYNALITNPARRFALASVQTLAWLALVVGLYVGPGIALSMSYVLVAGFIGFLTINLYYYIQERDQKALIREAFGQYLSPKVVSILVKDPSKLSLGGERREMTAFFSDVAGFSTISEQLTPDQLVALLNEYLTHMCNIIAEYDGTVDKFEGDAIIGFWGAPLEQKNHAELACMATIDMQRFMMGYRKQLIATRQPVLNIRVGLNTGDMLVGNLGSKQRMDYTIMGDAVNLASRLEGANKQYSTKTMLSEHTLRHVKDLVEVRELDRIRVVGKREAVVVYELLERKGYLPAESVELLARYARGLEMYRRGAFADALKEFNQALLVNGDDGPAQTYVARCEQFLRTPPSSSWDGVFELESK